MALSKLQMHIAFEPAIHLLGVYPTDKLAHVPNEYVLVSHCSALSLLLDTAVTELFKLLCTAIFIDVGRS